MIDAEGHEHLMVYETTRPFLERKQVLRNDGTLTDPVRIVQKNITFGFDDEGNLHQRVVSVKTAADATEVITETWDYDEGWLSLHTLESNADSSKKFRTSFTFERSGGRITNVDEVRRLEFDGTPRTTALDYNAHGRLSKATLPDAHAISWVYYSQGDDALPLIRNGLVRRVTHLDSDGETELAALLTRFDYNNQGRTDEITDARDNVTQITWDDLGRPESIENMSLGEKTVLSYGGPNPTDPGREVVGVEIGRKGATAGAATQFRYDGLGNLQKVFRGAAAEPYRSFANDSAGLRRTAVDGAGRTLSYEYDRLGRRTLVTDEASHETSSTYDAVGNLIEIEDGEDFVRRFDYDALDRLILLHEENIDGLGTEAVTKFGYDAAGNVTLVEDGNTHKTTYEYDALSRLGYVTRPDQQGGQNPEQIAYRYDGRGRLDDVINARGQKLDYIYEAWGPLKQVDHYASDAAPTPERTIEYDYDLAGNLLEVDDSAIPVPPDSVYRAVSPDPGAGDPPPPYDALNRLRRLEIRLPGLGVKTLTYSYDRFGNREGLVFEEGAETFEHTYTYDDAVEDGFDRLKKARLPGMGAAEEIVFTYLQNETPMDVGHEELDLITWPSGVGTDFDYEDHGPLSQISVTGSAGNLDILEYFARDDVDRIKTLKETFGGDLHTYAYGYDPAGRLTSAGYPSLPGLPTSEGFAYDLAGNREDPVDPGAYEYNENDELTKSPFDPVLCYDADGNIATKRSDDGCASGTITESFTYNHVNRLTRWTDGTTTVSFLYDPFGRRVKKEVSGGATTWFVWDGDRLLAEYDGSSGSRQARYAYVGGFAPMQLGVPDGQGGEEIYDVHTDHLDTPRMLTDQSQNVVWRAAFEAFGKAVVDDDPDGDLNPVTFTIRFPGQYFDEETGLHYNRFRYYDPGVGRYVSADPIGQNGILEWAGVSLSRPVLLPGVVNPFSSLPPKPLFEPIRTLGPSGVTGDNLFTYGGNSPLNNADPTGENLVVVVLAAAAGVAAVAYSIWSYLQAAEACKKLCDAEAEAEVCPSGDTSCYQECMAGANKLITSTGGGSEISTGVGGGLSATE